MPKNRARPVIKLEDYKRKLEDRAARIEAGGRVFVIPPVALLTRDQMKAINEAGPSDVEGQARAIMGDEELDAFCAAGGSEFIILDLFGEEGKDDEEAGEG